MKYKEPARKLKALQGVHHIIMLSYTPGRYV
jgi:hypothetical protein